MFLISKKAKITYLPQVKIKENNPCLHLFHPIQILNNLIKIRKMLMIITYNKTKIKICF